MTKLLFVLSILALPLASFTFTGCSSVKEGNNAVSDTNRTTNQTLNNASNTQSTAKRISK
ncbi:MAG: hypothetical protein LBV28_00540 [Puniceicoccales bacterium]|jgi:outer membrane lipoprotein-sorting protein|nr:hypothetical protein [Puniceicoccales bacterium]